MWLFDSHESMEPTPILFCAYHMANNYSSYQCNQTNLKQCSVNFCVPINDECPIKGVLFSESGIGQKINDKWNF